MSFINYKIIETQHGPQISHSTKSIYDVMASQEEGDDLSAICLIHGLGAGQVHMAEAYIEQHRSTLKLDPVVIAQKKAERQTILKAIADERAKIRLESSPERQLYEDMLEQHQRYYDSAGSNGRPPTPEVVDYKIIETGSGPMISHSRISVYDIMISQQDGSDFFALCTIHELRPIQVQIALDYISTHRADLESDLAMILPKKIKQRAYYEAIAAERAKIPVEMTPKHQAFYALVEKNRQQRGQNGVTSYS